MSAIFELDPKHPGRNDDAYLRRRRMFHDLARAARLGGEPAPLIEYTPAEHEIWRHVAARLQATHDVLASRVYLGGRDRLALQGDLMPQVRELSGRLEALTGFTLEPAEGLIPSREFFAALAQRRMPCTQFLRHGSRPEYTPEPDAVHDVIGHLPLLVDPDYADIVRTIGGGAALAASDEHVEVWSRWYWFGIEFSLVDEDDRTRILGAGLLSSFGEMEHALGPDVQRRPFSLEAVISCAYDPTVMQPLLFVVPSLARLRAETLRLIEHLHGPRAAADVLAA